MQETLAGDFDLIVIHYRRIAVQADIICHSV